MVLQRKMLYISLENLQVIEGKWQGKRLIKRKPGDLFNFVRHQLDSASSSTIESERHGMKVIPGENFVEKIKKNR